MVDWGIKEYVTAYAAAVGTAAMLWHFANLWRLWRDKDSITLTFTRGGSTVAGLDESILVRYLNLQVRNDAPNPIYIERLDIIPSKMGITMFPDSGKFPCTIAGFHTVTVQYFPLSVLLSEPKSIAVLDGRKRRWRVKRVELSRAISQAREFKKQYDDLGIDDAQISLIDHWGDIPNKAPDRPRLRP